jgi:GNAT superfamily N-acetyltransferase
MSPLFQAADLTAERVADADSELFQPLLERCDDFYRRVYGRPANPDEAKLLPLDRPPGLPPEKGHMMALRDAGGKLVGVMEGIRDFPGPDEWYLGLLLLAPEVRGQRRGEAVIQGYEAWVRGQGAKLLRLGVAEPNPAAHRFWLRVGYREEQWVGPVQMGELTYRVLRMSKPREALAASP